MRKLLFIDRGSLHAWGERGFLGVLRSPLLNLTWAKAKLTMKKEITVGNIMATVAFLVTVGLMQFPKHSDVAVILSDVARHEKSIEQLATIENAMSANLQVLTRIVNDHLVWDKPVSPEELLNYRSLTPLSPEEKALIMRTPTIQLPPKK